MTFFAQCLFLLICSVLGKTFNVENKVATNDDAVSQEGFQEKEFDFYVFSQMWDVTDCMMWEEEKHQCGKGNNNKCSFQLHSFYNDSSVFFTFSIMN